MIVAPEIQQLTVEENGMSVWLGFAGHQTARYEMLEHIAELGLSYIDNIDIYDNGMVKISDTKSTAEIDSMWLWLITAAPARHKNCGHGETPEKISASEDYKIDVTYTDGLEAKIELSSNLISGLAEENYLFVDSEEAENFEMSNYEICFSCLREEAQSNIIKAPSFEAYKETYEEAVGRIQTKKNKLKRSNTIVKIAAPVAAVAGGTATAMAPNINNGVAGAIAGVLILAAGGVAIAMNKGIREETEQIEKEWKDFADKTSEQQISAEIN